MSIESVFPIRKHSVMIKKEAEIKEFVEEPLVLSCIDLYRKNIQTVMSSANKENISKGAAYITIDWDSLSEENKTRALEVGSLIEEFGRKILRVYIVVDQDSTVEEISRKVMEIARRFEKQPMIWAPKHSLGELRRLYGVDPESEDLNIEDFVSEGYFYDRENRIFYESEEHFLKSNPERHS